MAVPLVSLFNHAVTALLLARLDYWKVGKECLML